MKKLLSFAILTSLFCSPVNALTAPDQGTIQITVLDQEGNPVADAPVFIYGMEKTRFAGGVDVPGSTTFSMKEGTYRISSALIKRTGEYIDRFASNEARISVVAGDNVSLVLTLKPVEMPDQRPTSYAQLHVAEVPGNMYHNN